MAKAKPKPQANDPAVPFTVRLPPLLYEELRNRAHRDRAPFTEVVAISVAKHLSGGGRVEDSPTLGSLSVSERRQLLVCLDIIRNARGRDRAMFNAIVRWWSEHKG